MNKTDLIKLRVTPQFKSDVQRHASFAKLSVSEYVERALENEMRGLLATAKDFHRQAVAKILDPEAPLSDKLAEKLVEVQPWVERRAAEVPLDVATIARHPVVGCPHGRPSPKVCWECT